MAEFHNRMLSELGGLVLRRFRLLQLTLHQESTHSITSDKALEIEETNDRFILWASNIGLFNPAHSSLDYRLRDNEQIKTFTCTLLETLGDNAQRSENPILTL